MKLLFLILFGATSASFAQNNLTDQIDFYQHRYPLQDVTTKLVNNHGNGFDALYGTRNFRAVLSGIVYRGGANNAYNKIKKRDNSNPLPPEGLENLCKEGFATAVYLYPTNYNSAAHAVDCKAGHLDYLQKSVLSSSARAVEILKLVGDVLNGVAEGPVYLHCWNGWHASGFISALILRQYCGFSGEQAVDYWNKNTDGANVGSSYDSIRDRLRKFQPLADLKIENGIREKVCPH